VKLSKESVRSLYKIYSDYGVNEKNYGETLAEVHEIWQMVRDQESVKVTADEKTKTEG